MRPNFAPRCGRFAFAGCLLLVSLLLIAAPSFAQPPAPEVIADAGDRVVLRYVFPPVELEPMLVNGALHYEVRMAGTRPAKDWVGAPELPRRTDSVLLPDRGQVALRVLEQRAHVVEGIDVAPSKGVLSRTVDPASVPHAFGAHYALDEPFPAAVAALREPYVMRDHRGVTLEIYPVQSNPVRRTLTVIDELTVEVTSVGADGPNPLVALPRRGSAAFRSIYRHHFVNFPTTRYDAPVEEGGMLVIVHDEWLPNVQSFVDHKSSIGIPTTAVGVSTIGNDSTAIKAAIQSAYDEGDLAFVLLVGDVAQVASPMAHDGASDAIYAKLAGDDDYPDALLGRFSAESAADVDTQVARTIAHELGGATAQDWYKRSVGIGSAEGPGDDGELDYQHIDKIRDVLLGYDYTVVDQIYDPGASPEPVVTALNEGRGLINYCGHGSMDAWTSSGFSNGNIQALENQGRLPFIISVACVNGALQSGTCFGETWLRSTREGEPIGAVGAYMSSINQSWDPPMAAQDEAARLLTLESTFTLGGLCYAGSGQMLDDYGAAGVEMFDTWILFGDPSLRIFGVVEPPSGIAVSPFKGLAGVGSAGGPFEPAEVVYTVHNYGDSAVELEVRSTMPWLGVSPTSGTLEPDEELTVTVSFNDYALLLDDGAYGDRVDFVNLTDHDGDSSRDVVLQVGEATTQLEWPLDEDPGWETEGLWAFGPPTGSSADGGSLDPTGGHTGDNVYGYNLDGAYQPSMGEQHLTTTAIDCGELSHVSVRFWRWLGVETSEYDHATMSVSTDGETWTRVWQNSAEISDSTWIEQEVDISSHADGQPTVYLRWTMGPTDDYYQYCGWNIDDIEIRALPAGGCWDFDRDGFEDELCGGDDCDDLEPETSPDATETCDDGVDNDCNGQVDHDDAACTGAGGTGSGAGGPGAGADQDDGCDCRLGRSRSHPHRAGLLAGAMLALLMRRRSRAPRSTGAGLASSPLRAGSRDATTAE